MIATNAIGGDPAATHGELLWWLVVPLFVVFAGGDHLSRINPRATFLVYAAILCSCPLWLLQPLEGWFEFAKIFSIFIPIQLMNALRLTSALESENSTPSCCFQCAVAMINSLARSTWDWVFFFVLILNISEAAVADVQLGNYANAACGVTLLISQPLPDTGDAGPSTRRFMGIDKGELAKSPYFDFLYDLPLGWSLLYTTWNLCFCLDKRRSHFLCVCVVLLAPLLRALLGGRSDLWMQSRIYTLAIRYTILGYYDIYDLYMDSSTLFDADVVYWWGLANVALGVVYVLWFFGLATRRNRYEKVLPS
eukprot:TRINITY_DN41167_c0_g1_i1.p1 TRINITY_DN41167_c0_g1~~TRINITY_DN41167_c0_g1_i1.p1  ORF type:complete len:331 (+),score=29.41 TRINITY_DN41167_c0_g1_i1:72-995(+)